MSRAWRGELAALKKSEAEELGGRRSKNSPGEGARLGSEHWMGCD